MGRGDVRKECGAGGMEGKRAEWGE